MSRIPLLRASRDAVRYGFAVGKVRVLETRIFGSDVYERLITARDIVEQERVLSDTYFGRFLEGARTSGDVERAFDEATGDAYSFLDESGLPAPVVRFFRVRHDYANLKSVLAAERLGAPLEPLLSPLGLVEAEAFRSPESLPSFLRDLYHGVRGASGETAEEEVGAGVTLERQQEIVDAAMFADLAESAEASRSDFLRGLAALFIDLANARALLRAYREGRSFGEVRETLLEGGSLDAREIEDVYGGAPEEVARAIARHPALGALVSGAFSEDEDPLRRFDVTADDVVLRYVRATPAASFGPEPVIAYVMAREAQIVTLRVLLLGKLAGLDPDTLRSRLRAL